MAIMAVTKEQGDRVIEEIRKEFGLSKFDSDEGYGPTLDMDWSYLPEGRLQRTAIFWEQGPFEWAMDAVEYLNGTDSDVYLEPYNGWALLLYPA